MKIKEASYVLILLVCADCVPVYDCNPIVNLLLVVAVALHLLTANRLMMNWITVLCVAVFLSCQCSVGHGQEFGKDTLLTAKEFNERYKDRVTPAIAKKMGCDELELNYLFGSYRLVSIRLRPSLLVFCILD